MSDRQLDTEAIMSWALAFVVLVGVTMCLRVITLEADAHAAVDRTQVTERTDVARR